MIIYVFLIVTLFMRPICGSYFHGGTISWRPETKDQSEFNTTRTIIISQRYAWEKSTMLSSCSPSTILSYGLIGDNSTNTLNCLSSLTTCNASDFPTNLTALIPCTDYNNALNMSSGESFVSLNLTVQEDGLVIGYGSYSTNLEWIPLNMINGTALANLSMYLNLTERMDNGLINSSPTSSIPFVVLVPVNIDASIDIPMADVDGDILQCRFAQSFQNWSGIIINECGDVCHSMALPNSTELISDNNVCTLNITLPSSGYYAVAVQLEDFLENATEPLSSIPLQFVLYAYHETNLSTNCTLPPVITSIDPDHPQHGSTVYAAVNVPYTATINAQSGCGIEPNTSIINFITSSPPGMLKTDVPFLEDDITYGINLMWVPSDDQLGMTYRFCAVAIDINLYMSNQYCFNFIVGPKTTTAGVVITQPQSTSTTSLITTTSKQINYFPLGLGLGLGIGLPLLCLLSLIARCYLCRCCLYFHKLIVASRYAHRTDMNDLNSSQLISKSTKSENRKNVKDMTDYREQYINEHSSSSAKQNRLNLSKENSFASSMTSALELGSLTTTTTSMFSSITNTLPTDRVERFASPLSTSHLLPPTGSILVRAYNKQQNSV
ncbi:hypothetical protein I4U23_011425 [Adineta vaga]|nr:hypothetical protein I4U23_011425 [Adineta vaga]